MTRPRKESVDDLAEVIRQLLKPEWAMGLGVVNDWPTADGVQVIVLAGTAALYPVEVDGKTFMAVESNASGSRDLYSEPVDAIIAFVLEPMKIACRKFLKEKHKIE